MFKDNFARYEFKFPISFDTMDKLLLELKPYAAPDANGSGRGVYIISSLYLDNDRCECFYETMNGDLYRQKVRLRVYGEENGPDSLAFLELKSKIKGLVLKRRVKMTLKDAMDFINECVEKGLETDFTKYKSSNPQILREIMHVIVTKALKPKIIVSYERLALNTIEKSDLRITFDYKLRTRDKDLDLTHGTYGEGKCPEHVVVLEVKTGKEIPFWLVEILKKYNYKNQTFSKYCSHYQQMYIDAKLLENKK